MRVTGIIAEYNPFHNGHKYQLERARKLTEADYLIVVMSGDFTQRGAPAIMDKYFRAQMALENGADLVLELPTCYACSSAEHFSNGAIALLDKLGVVNSICFGSESGDINALKNIASILLEESPEYKKHLRNYISSGSTYPQARNFALESLYPDCSGINTILTSPNNILGIEYVKAIFKRKSSIEPYTNIRVGADYHDRKLSSINSSAIAIRHALKNNSDISLLESQVPENVFHIFKEEINKTFPIYHADISSILKYRLFLDQAKGYTEYADVSRELSDRISHSLLDFTTFDDYSFSLKTKNITYTRVCRGLLHILLNITKRSLFDYQQQDYCFYGRILGFREQSTSLLNSIKNNSTIPLISKLADAESLLNEIGQIQLKQDILSSHIYAALVSEKYGTPMQHETKRRILKV